MKDSNKDLTLAKKQIGAMQAMVEATAVTNDAELGEVADKIKKVKTLAKFVKEKKEKFTEPAKAIIAEARETYDPLLKACETAERQLKVKAGLYMTAKEEARRKEEARIAARVEKGTMKPETAMRKMETITEAPKTVRTDTGSALRMAKRRVAKITDKNLIPDQYWVVDEVRVRQEALARDKAGLEQIPGVTVEEVTDLSSF